MERVGLRVEATSFNICFGQNELVLPLPAHPRLASIYPSYKYPVFEPLTYNFLEAESKATPFLIEISPYGRSSA